MRIIILDAAKHLTSTHRLLPPSDPPFAALNCRLITVNCDPTMTNEERKAALEAIIYAADEPATLEQLSAAIADERLAVQSSLDELIASYASEERGIEIRAVAGGYKMYTKPQQHDVVRRFMTTLRPPLRLSF